MKNSNLKSFIGTGTGLTLAMIMYDWLSHGSIGWIRAVFADNLVIVLIYVSPFIAAQTKNL